MHYSLIKQDQTYRIIGKGYNLHEPGIFTLAYNLMSHATRLPLDATQLDP